MNLIYKSCCEDIQSFQKLPEYSKFMEIMGGLNKHKHPFFLKLLFQLYLFWSANSTLVYPFIRNNPLNLIPVALSIINDPECDFLFYLDGNDICINRTTLDKSIKELSLIEMKEISLPTSTYTQLYKDMPCELNKKNIDNYLSNFTKADFQLIGKCKHLPFVSTLNE